MKAFMVGLWVLIVSLGASYAVATLDTSGKPGEAVAKPSLTVEKTRVLNVPMIANGAVRGFIVAQFNYTVDAAKGKGTSISPEVFLLDEAFRAIYTDDHLDFLHLEKYDIGGADCPYIGGDEQAAGLRHGPRRSGAGFHLHLQRGERTMRAPSSDAGMTRSEFDALEIGRLTWIGLTLSGIGWAMLLGEAALADILVTKVPRALPPTFHADLLDIAKCIIVSGFGLAIVGALQTGFGALNRFFEAVLMRSNGRAGGAQQSASVASSHERPMPSDDKRPYRLLPDGSVEVETILGTRRFETMAEAREFI